MHTAVEHFLGQGVDGVAIIAPTTEVAQAIAAIASPVPIVLISSASDVPPVAHLHAVGVDQRHGARLATQHLLDQGHSERACTSPGRRTGSTPRTGWPAGGRCPDRAAPEHIEAGWDAADGYELGLRMVREGLPSAIFAANDQLALGLLHAFWERGVRVPDDVAVVGFDDEVGAAHYTPPLTTVRQDFGALGRLAVEFAAVGVRR